MHKCMLLKLFLLSMRSRSLQPPDHPWRHESQGPMAHCFHDARPRCLSWVCHSTDASHAFIMCKEPRFASCEVASSEVFPFGPTAWMQKGSAVPMPSGSRLGPTPRFQPTPSTFLGLSVVRGFQLGGFDRARQKADRQCTLLRAERVFHHVRVKNQIKHGVRKHGTASYINILGLPKAAVNFTEGSHAANPFRSCVVNLPQELAAMRPDNVSWGSKQCKAGPVYNYKL